MDNNKVWYVTGASNGLALSLVKKLLKLSYNVAATSKNLEALINAVGYEQSNQFLPLQADLINEHSVCTSLSIAREVFGKLDVIVNNAGYGTDGATEELNATEIAENINTNLLGTNNVAQIAIPYLRSQGFGHLFNVASIAGFTPCKGCSVYAAAKFAIIGLSKALAQQAAPFDIKVTAVAPGAFGTQFLTPQSIAFAAYKIAGYTETKQEHDRDLEIDDAQTNDLDKAADLLIAAAANPNPPLMLFWGGDAY